MFENLPHSAQELRGGNLCCDRKPISITKRDLAPPESPAIKQVH